MGGRILVTGCSGFIGMHLCKRLLSMGYEVSGIDNMNSYYSPKLKKDRLSNLLKFKNFRFFEIDISNLKSLKKTFSISNPNKVVNLAAQAGVRYSLKNPHSYIESNIKGFMNILECCRYDNVSGLIYASSSSVYGSSKKNIFSIQDKTDSPISIYAASKKCNELMAHAYSSLYNLNTTGLRFFTVYGPWGRPDMAMYIFAENILNGKKIKVFNNGEMLRDFTYIDDIIDGVISSIEKNYFCEVFNLGNNKSENLRYMISLIENKIGKKANIVYEDMQLGDVKNTFADIDYSKEKLGFIPQMDIVDGIPKFVQWYLDYRDYF